jgi:UDP-glucose 4-epimerase
MVSVPLSVADPEGCFERNVVGTECVVRAAARAGVAGFVHTSSSAVYGPHPYLPSRECDPIACASPYAASKVCGELLVQAAALSSGLPGVSLRLFNVFGPRQDPKSPYAAAVSAFIGAAFERRSCKIYGSGNQTRDFVPVTQVVEAFLVAGAYGRRVAGESFNVGLGRGTSVRELAAVIAHVAGSEAPPELHPPRATWSTREPASTRFGMPSGFDWTQISRRRLRVWFVPRYVTAAAREVHESLH